MVARHGELEKIPDIGSAAAGMLDEIEGFTAGVRGCGQLDPRCG
ncbi:MAG: hypothetical protein QJR12_16720 [Mycobacterium sp.]|nr:hypothetical protein [Mycobacterium sp.]MDI3315850.1 hypothetical protein [Mycobacterium sp.]